MNILQSISFFAFLPLIGKGIAAGILFALPVGPLASISLNRTLENGLKAGLFSFAGMAVADLIYILIAAFGVSIVKDFINEYFQIIKYFSFAVIVFIGITMIFAKPPSNLKITTVNNTSSNTKAFIFLFLLGISNPVALFVFINLFPLLSKNSKLPTPLTLTILTVSILTGMILWWGTLTYFTNYFRKFVPASKFINVRKVAGILILGMVSVSILFSFWGKSP